MIYQHSRSKPYMRNGVVAYGLGSAVPVNEARLSALPKRSEPIRHTHSYAYRSPSNPWNTYSGPRQSVAVVVIAK